MPTLGELLVKALTPPQPPPKELLLRDPYTPLESHDKLWTPAEADFSSPRRELEELYARRRDFENSLYAQGRNLEKSLSSPQGRELFLLTRNTGGSLPDLRAPQPPAKSLTLTEQAALFGKAIQSIPETLSGISDAIQGVPKAAAEIGARFRTLGITIGRGLDWLERHFPAGPLDPYGRPVPQWNVRLYLLARSAYRGNIEARVRFLDEIEAEGTDAPTYIEALLRPTFEPAPQDMAGRRAAWEQSSPEAARKWLRKRLHDLRYQQEAPCNRKVDAGDIEHLLEAPAHPEANPELWAFCQSEVEARRKKIGEILPPKQYEVFLLMEKGLPPQEIARARGKAPGTIKKQVWEIRNNPQLRAVGEQLREELWWGRPAWE